MTPENASLIKQALAKHADEGPEGHFMRRGLLGNPLSTAIESRPGEKMKGFGEAYGHSLQEGLKGMGQGALMGGAGGAAAGGLLGAMPPQGYHGPKGPGGMASRMGQGALIVGALGAMGGGLLGNVAGSLKGHYDQTASTIHGKYSKNLPKDGDGDGKLNEDAQKEGAFYELGYKTALERLGL